MSSYIELIEKRRNLLAQLAESEQALSNTREEILRDRETMRARQDKEFAELKAKHERERKENDDLLSSAGLTRLPTWPKDKGSEKQWLDAQTRSTRAKMRGKYVKTDQEYKRRMAAGRLQAMLQPSFAARFYPNPADLKGRVDQQISATCEICNAESAEELVKLKVIEADTLKRYDALVASLEAL